MPVVSLEGKQNKVFYMASLCPEHSCFKINFFFFWPWQGLHTKSLLNCFLLTLTDTKKLWMNANHSFHSQIFMLFKPLPNSSLYGTRGSQTDLKGEMEITFAAWGVQAMCTVLGFTPFALGLLNKANLLFLLPLSPFGRDPLYLSKSTEKEPSPSFLYHLVSRKIQTHKNFHSKHQVFSISKDIQLITFKSKNWLTQVWNMPTGLQHRKPSDSYTQILTPIQSIHHIWLVLLMDDFLDQEKTWA